MVAVFAVDVFVVSFKDARGASGVSAQQGVFRGAVEAALRDQARIGRRGAELGDGGGAGAPHTGKSTVGLGYAS